MAAMLNSLSLECTALLVSVAPSYVVLGPNTLSLTAIFVVNTSAIRELSMLRRNSLQCVRTSRLPTASHCDGYGLCQIENWSFAWDFHDGSAL